MEGDTSMRDITVKDQSRSGVHVTISNERRTHVFLLSEAEIDDLVYKLTHRGPSDPTFSELYREWRLAHNWPSEPYYDENLPDAEWHEPCPYSEPYRVRDCCFNWIRTERPLILDLSKE